MNPQAFTEFQPLEEILIGRNFDSKVVDNFDALPKVKSLLKVLLDETEEDFQHLVKVCETYGAKVIRPEYHYSKITNFSYPYLNQPRDCTIVLDNKIIDNENFIMNKYQIVLINSDFDVKYSINRDILHRHIVNMNIFILWMIQIMKN